MTAVDHAPVSAGAAPGFLSRENTIAKAKFNRWLVPPAALAIHLSIGMAYGFSVFWKPLANALPNTPASCASQGFFDQLTTTSCNWTIPTVTPVFEIFIAVLGIAAAIWGGWLEHAGPRKAGLFAALCWGGGLVLVGFGISIHQLWVVYLASILAGIGQGLGYITPVSTLIKWFPDRRGLATGFAIMGYGGGAMIGAPLAVWLMAHMGQTKLLDVAYTLMILGVIYFVAMSLGALGFRVPPTGWYPLGFDPKAVTAKKSMIATRSVHLSRAWKTPQFWLIWGVLCMNVTAGIAVISIASPMLTDIFGAELVGAPRSSALTPTQTAAVVAAAAGLVGLISLFNSLGRLFWAGLSDKLGRKTTYFAILIIGIVTYCLLPTWAHLGIPALFVISICLILSMYGGGFATVPAYLADIFGPQMVGAIHGRLITAWSVAGVVGPVLIANLRQFQLDHGVAKTQVYNITLYIMAGLLLVGVICNFFVKPVDPKYQMTDEEIARERALLNEDRVAANASAAARGSFGAVGIIAWLAVGIPFFIGLVIAIQKAAGLF